MIPQSPERDVLSHSTVQEVLSFKRDIHMYIDVGKDDSISTALKLMLEGDVLSLPVYEESGGKRKYVDLVTIEDIRNHIISWDGLDDEIKHQELGGKSRGPTVLEEPVSNIVSKPHSKPPVISINSSLDELLALFSECRRHRVLVNMSEGDESPPVSLTQSDLLRFLNHNNHKFGAYFDLAVSEIAKLQGASAIVSDNSSHLATIKIRETALNGFQKLRDLHLGALGILDGDGRLVTELAGTSLRWLTEDKINLLGRPVLAYLFGLNCSISAPYICRKEFTISQVTMGLLRTKARRAWILDSMNRPIGVITLNDLLSVFQTSPQQTVASSRMNIQSYAARTIKNAH
ncbi:hypothetical protein H4219_000645 [Mycoemilia scoparia]|uniref:CBS domain-containing protein n=1 Tax=Mycoemilia scoparia TaxID=417184 RepID=A0A9W8DR80_9FUNG|nr:hypothetical protein H4219_000645 [Mycoemilia scoparia]